MQLKRIQNTIKTQWNRFHLPYPSTESIVPVAETREEFQIVMSVLAPKQWTTTCFVPAGASALLQSFRMGIHI
jgi:hypothetical protein